MDFSSILFLVFKKIWPLIFLLLLVYLFTEFYPLLRIRWKRNKKFKAGEKWRSDRELLQWLRKLKPSEFEHYISKLFSSLGYTTETVGKSHDGGVDVVAKKDGKTHYIQCKKYITSEVTLGDIRDFYGALADHLANCKGYFITTNKFTLEARQFVKDKPIELIDGFELVRYIKMAKTDNPKEEIESIKKTCPECKGQLIERTGKYGKFIGCSNYPKCKYTEKL